MLVASVPVLGRSPARRCTRKRAGRAPLVEPSIFTHRSYTAGVGFDLVFVGSMGGIILIFNVLLQAGLGFSPLHSALSTVPWAVGAFVGSAIGGITMGRLGRRVLHAGLVVEAVGLLGIYAVLRDAGTGVGSLDLLAPMLVGGIGMGMVFVPLFDIVMAGVEPAEMGSAAGVLKSVDGLGHVARRRRARRGLLRDRRPGRRPRVRERRRVDRAGHSRAAGDGVRGRLPSSRATRRRRSEAPAPASATRALRRPRLVASRGLQGESRRAGGAGDAPPAF